MSACRCTVGTTCCKHTLDEHAQPPSVLMQQMNSALGALQPALDVPDCRAITPCSSPALCRSLSRSASAVSWLTLTRPECLLPPCTAQLTDTTGTLAGEGPRPLLQHQGPADHSAAGCFAQVGQLQGQWPTTASTQLGQQGRPEVRARMSTERDPGWWLALPTCTRPAVDCECVPCSTRPATTQSCDQSSEALMLWPPRLPAWPCSSRAPLY